MHIGHLICRYKYVGLGKAFVMRHKHQWRVWMNSPTFSQKLPLRWSPLMCFMESSLRSRTRDTGQGEIHLLLHFDRMPFKHGNTDDSANGGWHLGSRGTLTGTVGACFKPGATRTERRRVDHAHQNTNPTHGHTCSPCLRTRTVLTPQRQLRSERLNG